MLTPDQINASFEIGSAIFGCLNIQAIRKSKSLAGVHWAPTMFFFVWGLWNLIFYPSLGQYYSLFAGMVITIVNLAWLIHVGVYCGGFEWLKLQAKRSCLSFQSKAQRLLSWQRS